jgi:hypothetical protein
MIFDFASVCSVFSEVSVFALLSFDDVFSSFLLHPVNSKDANSVNVKNFVIMLILLKGYYKEIGLIKWIKKVLEEIV